MRKLTLISILIILIAQSGCGVFNSRTDCSKIPLDDYISTVQPASQDDFKTRYQGYVPTRWKPDAKFIEGDLVYILDYAFIGPDRFHTDTPSNMQIIDISDRTKPFVVSSFQLKGKAWAIAVKDNFAYIATSKGMIIIDVSDIKSPVETGFFQTDDHSEQISIRDDYIYLLESTNLFVFRITSPGKIRRVFNERVKYKADQLSSMAIDDKYLYISPPNSLLMIFDIDNPVKPVLKGIIKGVKTVRRFVRVENLIFAAENGGKITIQDISDFEDPNIVNSFPSQGNVHTLWVNNDILYSIASDRIASFDISDPLNPEKMVVSEPLKHSLAGIDITNDYIYASTHRRGLRIFEFSHQPDGDASINLLGKISAPSNLMDCVVKDNYVLAVNSRDGLVTIDVSDPPNPYIVSVTDIPRHSGAYAHYPLITADDQFVYITRQADLAVYDDWCYREQSELLIFDISNPLEPILTGSVFVPQLAKQISKSGNYIYMSQLITACLLEPIPTTIVVIDVSDPYNSVKATDISIDRMDFTMKPAKDHLYLYPHGTLEIYKTGPPEYLTRIDYPNPIEWVSAMDIHGDRAYIRSGKNILIADISEPSKPVILETINYDEIAKHDKRIESIHYHDNKLIIKAPLRAVRYLDLANPEKGTTMMDFDGYEIFKPVASFGDHIGFLCSGSNIAGNTFKTWKPDFTKQ